MTPRSPTGSPSSSATRRQTTALSAARLTEPLRYGENPHQKAAFYRTPERALRRRDRAAGAGQAALLQQYQRYRRGLRTASPNSIRRGPPPCAIIKHANPCGVAEGDSLVGRLSQGAALRSGLGLRRHRRPQPHARRRSRARTSPRFSPRSSSRRTPTKRPSPSSAPRKTCGFCSTGGLPDPRAAGLTAQPGRRRPSGAIARQRRRRRHGSASR